MKTTVTALCALLLAAPAWAQQQQDVFRNDLPETSVTPGEQPPRDTSRSEGVNIGEEQQAEAGQLSPQVRQALAALSRNAVAAQQFGNLATTKQAPGNIRDLGDRMVIVNSEINERLDVLAERHSLQLPQRMPEQDQNFFRILADTNQEDFARGLVAWVNDIYPRTIQALQTLTDQPGFTELAEVAIPQLRDQLRATQQLAQSYGEGATQVQAEAGGQRGALDVRPGELSQADEPQHTAETERETRSPSELYRQPQVGTDPQSRTLAPPGDRLAAIPAGDLDVANAGGLLAAIANIDVEMRQFDMTSDIQPDQVRVIPTQEIIPSESVESVRLSVQENQGEIERLRRAIGQQDTLAQALRGSNSSPGEVIAMDVLDEGIVLYTMGPQQAQTPAR